MSNQHPKEVNNFMKDYNGPRCRVAPIEIASFENRYGDKKIIHVTRAGLRVKNNQSTVAIELNKKIATLIGAKIKARRLELGLSLEDACVRSGLAAPSPKSRMWEIENCIAKHGLRMGTLYAIALGLDTTPNTFMPSLEEVLDGTSVVSVTEKTLKVKP